MAYKDKSTPAALPPVQRPWPGHCVLHLRPLRLCHLALSCCHCYCCSRRRYRCSLSPVGPLAQRPRLISVLPSPRLRRGPCGASRPPAPPPPPPPPSRSVGLRLPRSRPSRPFQCLPFSGGRRRDAHRTAVRAPARRPRAPPL